MKTLRSLISRLNQPIELRPRSAAKRDQAVAGTPAVEAPPRPQRSASAGLRRRRQQLLRRLRALAPQRRSRGPVSRRAGIRKPSISGTLRAIRLPARSVKPPDGPVKLNPRGGKPKEASKLRSGGLRLRPRSARSGHRGGGNVIGLDIQPGFIAAVEANVNGSIRAARAATAALEGDIVTEGEVADENALSGALRELFDESGIGRRVRVGVANQRTVLRILEMPPLSDPKELAAAVRFQAQDQVPMPLSNAVLDFHPLGVIDTPVGPRQRVVVVAAQRDMIERLVSAVRGAGLRPVGVDLSAFALIRALFHPDAEHAGRVLYLNVDGLTNLAIAEGTSCRFNRVVGVGLEGMADELAKRTRVSRTEARSLLAAVDLSAPALLAEPQPSEERAEGPEVPAAGDGVPAADLGAQDAAAQSDTRDVRESAMGFVPAQAAVAAAPGPRAPSPQEVRAVLEDGINELIGEVRNTLDFHASQDGGGNVSHVVLSGQALNVPGFVESLQTGLGMEVHGDSVGLMDPKLANTVSAGRLAVAAGLATVEAPQ
jgi:type IV pilus assembly protein PilM